MGGLCSDVFEIDAECVRACRLDDGNGRGGECRWAFDIEGESDVKEAFEVEVDEEFSIGAEGRSGLNDATGKFGRRPREPFGDRAADGEVTGVLFDECTGGE
jgi:hypothetical protein